MQQSRDVAHHVMQEGVGGDVDGDPFAVARHAQRFDAAHRRLRLALDGAEGAEVVLTHQHLRGIVHARGVERPPLPGRAALRQSRTRSRLRIT